MTRKEIYEMRALLEMRSLDYISGMTGNLMRVLEPFDPDPQNAVEYPEYEVKLSPYAMSLIDAVSAYIHLAHTRAPHYALHEAFGRVLSRLGHVLKRVER